MPASVPPRPQLSRPRHHRWLTAPSSLVLVICLFLPALEVCGRPTRPLEVPMFWTPYVIAALVFLGAFLSPYWQRGIAASMRAVIGLTALGFGVPSLAETAGDLVAYVVLVLMGIPLVAIAIPAARHETMIARCGLVAALGSLAWFVVLCHDEHALYGAQVSAVAAGALALGCAWWWIEAVLDAPRGQAC